MPKRSLCTQCATPIHLVPSAEERAAKYGKSAAYYRNLFRVCSNCRRNAWYLTRNQNMPDDENTDDFITQLRAAVPSLTDADIATSDFHSDVYVVAYPAVTAWLQAHYRWWSAVRTFRSPDGSAWNGAGRLCYDIPFGNGAAWKRKLSAGAKHA